MYVHFRPKHSSFCRAFHFSGFHLSAAAESVKTACLPPSPFWCRLLAASVNYLILMAFIMHTTNTEAFAEERSHEYAHGLESVKHSH